MSTGRDLQCAAAELIVREVQRRLGSRLRFIFRNFPLTEIHPAAEEAAEFAEAAATAGEFWNVHHALFAWSRQNGSESLGLPAFLAIADAIGLKHSLVVDALENHRFIERIREDFRGGVRSGVNGTPTFFVNGIRFDGRISADGLIGALQAGAV